MLSTERVLLLFKDARRLEALAQERLISGDVRDAAEKAWGLTKRAADALVLARTGEEPSTAGRTARGVRELRPVCCPSLLSWTMEPLEQFHERTQGCCWQLLR